MTRFRVRASGPLEGRVEVAGATKNSGVKQMAAASLAPGVTTLRNMPPVLDLDVMSDLLRAVGARVDQPDAQRRARRRVGNSATRSAVRARHAHARVVQRARPAARALRRGARRAAAAATTSGAARSTCTCAASSRWAPTWRSTHGFVHARCDAAAGRARAARVPERRRDGELDVRGRAGQGHDRDRERGPRARGHRPRGLPRPHGRASDGRWVPRPSRSKGSRS